MPNKHIDVNIPKAMSLRTGVGTSPDRGAPHTIASSVETANKQLGPPPTLQKLSNILHNTVSTVIAVLDASRPRVLCFARKVSSRVIFVGVLPILTSLYLTAAVAQVPAPGGPTGVTVTPGDRQFTVRWTHPSDINIADIDRYHLYLYNAVDDLATAITLWSDHNPTVVAANPYYIRKFITNGEEQLLRLRVVRDSSVDPNNTVGAWSSYLKVTPNMPAPADFTATLDTAAIGSRSVTLSWTAIPQLSFVTDNRDVTDYEYSQNGGAWTSIGSTSTTYSVTGLVNGRSYTFRVRGVRASEAKGTASPAVTVRPLIDAPGTPGGLNVERDEDTAILTWSAPSDEDILRYEYSDDGGSTWQSTGSTDTTYTVAGLEPGETYTFLVRAVYVDGETSRIISLRSSTSNSAVLNYPKPKRRIVYECPVGWTQGSVFGKTKKALIYELKVDADPTNRTSIYQLRSIAIYVHPDEGLETLDGWTLKVGTLYNQFGKEFKLTAENSVIDEYDFAHIENPEETPIPMGMLGYIGQSLPSFDYRLYDAQGVRVDFGISCYKKGGLTYRLWNTEDPRLLRVLPLGTSEEALSVQMQNLAWNTPFFRSEWTAAIMPDLPAAPAAPSQIKGTIVGTWADLKKQ